MSTTELAYTPRTIRAHREKWLQELESGNRLQAKGVLHKHSKGQDRFCCLGVATDLCGLKPLREEVTGAGVSVLHYPAHAGSEISVYELLPETAQAWLGLRDEDVVVNIEVSNSASIYPGATPVSTLNDRGWSFKKIAAAIREHGLHPSCDLLQEWDEDRYV